MRRVLAITVISLTSACSHQHPSTTVATIATPTAPPPTAQSKNPDPSPTPVSPHVAVSDELGKQCSLQFGNVTEAPKFAFDEFVLLPDDRTVLEQVATCVTNGPLKGRRLKLIGRADPRGTDEYNLGLGDRRARTVSEYLMRLGVGSSQVTVATRGALDANGKDETGWQVDRRVDLQLN